MKITSRMVLICACALVVCAPRLQAQGVRTIYLVRHADKVSDDVDAANRRTFGQEAASDPRSHASQQAAAAD